ncbi:MAG: hypothetical protein SPI30_01485 [Prevotella sp.]|nr:hypothetical protein [Prevotella sp.]
MTAHSSLSRQPDSQPSLVFYTGKNEQTNLRYPAKNKQKELDHKAKLL